MDIVDVVAVQHFAAARMQQVNLFETKQTPGLRIQSHPI
jgi:hypothetical protein